MDDAANRDRRRDLISYDRRPLRAVGRSRARAL